MNCARENPLRHLPLALLVVVSVALMPTRYVTADSTLPGIGGPFALVDEDGKAVTDKTYRGAWLLVFFGFTHCPDVCPTTLFHVARVMKGLGPDAERVQPLFITVDPERDTPEILRRYTAAFHERIIGLTGSEAQVAAVAGAYRAHYSKVPLPSSAGDYTMDHQTALYLMDPHGRFLTSYTFRDDPSDITQGVLAHLRR